MIDSLKSWGTKPQYSGLGFIFLHEPKKDIRWNFYCPDLTPVEVKDYHTHRIKFESQIIKGALINEVCKWKPQHESEYHLIETNCVLPHFRNNVIHDGVAIQNYGQYYLPAGAWYISESDTFHRVRCPEQTITKLKIFGKDTQNNLTIRNKNKAFRCPLKDFVKPEKELWEVLRTFF